MEQPTLETIPFNGIVERIDVAMATDKMSPSMCHVCSSHMTARWRHGARAKVRLLYLLQGTSSFLNNIFMDENGTEKLTYIA